jgi:hypothetical protein
MDLHTILPDYPRTRHLPWKPNAKRDDLIATEKEAAIIFESENVFVEEKIDGASVGISVVDGHPVVRNRNHILNKGYDRRRTAAKMQFAAIWNWFYANQDKFQALMELAGPVTVYGEWLWAVHGLEYDQLPAYFIPYDLFDHNDRVYRATNLTREWLELAGFATVPLLHRGTVASYEDLEAFTLAPSPFTTLAPREGIYVKVTDGKQIVQRFKMVRRDFIQGEHWSHREIKKNQLTKLYHG